MLLAQRPYRATSAQPRGGQSAGLWRLHEAAKLDSHASFLLAAERQPPRLSQVERREAATMRDRSLLECPLRGYDRHSMSLALTRTVGAGS